MPSDSHQARLFLSSAYVQMITDEADGRERRSETIQIRTLPSYGAGMGMQRRAERPSVLPRKPRPACALDTPRRPGWRASPCLSMIEGRYDPKARIEVRRDNLRGAARARILGRRGLRRLVDRYPRRPR